MSNIYGPNCILAKTKQNHSVKQAKCRKVKNSKRKPQNKANKTGYDKTGKLVHIIEKHI